jgi:DNA-binding TFAR19-related protein (PDSD5 family)
LEEIRERKLEELKEYMRANSNENNLETVSEEEIVDRLTTLNEMVDVKC